MSSEQEEFVTKLLRVLEGEATEGEEGEVLGALEEENERLEAIKVQTRELREETIRVFELMNLQMAQDAHEIQMELRSQRMM